MLYLDYNPSTLPDDGLFESLLESSRPEQRKKMESITSKIRNMKKTGLINNEIFVAMLSSESYR